MNPMNKKRTPARTRKADVPYSPKSKAATLKYWEGATAHQGIAELRAKRERLAKPVEDRKEQSRLRKNDEQKHGHTPPIPAQTYIQT